MNKLLSRVFIFVCYILFLNIAVANNPPNGATKKPPTLDKKQVMQKKDSHLVNLNTSTAKDIAKAFRGFGKKRASAIVAYRQEHGAFKSLDELANIKGISKRFVQNRMEALKKAFSL